MGEVPMLGDIERPASPMRAPQWSPRRTTRLQGTTLTTALGLVERDLSLQRGGGANVTTAEAWLEDMLELIAIDKGAPIRSEAVHGLARAKMSRAQLAVDGLDSAQAGKLYRLMFVHSFGLHQAVEELLKGCTAEAKASVGAKLFVL